MIDFIVYAASQSPWLSYWALPSLLFFAAALRQSGGILPKGDLSLYLTIFLFFLIYPIGIIFVAKWFIEERT